jgi:hypothetical protein
MMASSVPRVALSSKRLLWLIAQDERRRVGQAVWRTQSSSYHTSAPCWADKKAGEKYSSGTADDKTKSSPSRTGPVKIINTPRSAAAAKARAKAKRFFDQVNGESSTNVNGSKNHPAHHFVAGGTPCDPLTQPFFLAETGEDSLHTLVLLRHGESEWNALNRKCMGLLSTGVFMMLLVERFV